MLLGRSGEKLLDSMSAFGLGMHESSALCKGQRLFNGNDETMIKIIVNKEV